MNALHKYLKKKYKKTFKTLWLTLKRSLMSIQYSIVTWGPTY